MGQNTRCALRLGAPILIVLIAAAVHAVEDASDGPAYLIRNIAHGPDREESSEARGFVGARDLVFFTAEDGEHGRELWRTDGTPGGTRLVRDIVEGPDDGLARSTTPIAFGDMAAFTAEDGNVWRSDGSAEGTFKLVDGGSSLIVGFGDRLFVVSADWSGTNLALVLWRSDGTREGTIPLRRLPASEAGSQDCWENPSLELAGDRLYVIGSSGEGCTRIWAGDVAELLAADALESALPIDLPLSSSFDERPLLGTAGNVLLFVASDAERRVGLWRSDGTAEGSFPLLPGADTTPLFYRDSDWEPHFLVDADRAYFIANDGVHGLEPWVSDGTLAGTRLYANVVPGPTGVFPCADEIDYECERREGIENAHVNLFPRESGLLIARS